MIKLIGLLVVLSISRVALCQEAGVSAFQQVRASIFEELLDKSCDNSCTLKPRVGTPFKIEYKITDQEVEGGGTIRFAEVILNGKKFNLRGVGSHGQDALPLTQYLFFDDHRFQIYKMSSYKSTRAAFAYFFLREGDTFHLLTDEPVPVLSYDYENKGNKKDLERFYGDFGMGGYNFTGGPNSGPSYTRVFFKLEDNRLIETGREEL